MDRTTEAVKQGEEENCRVVYECKKDLETSVSAVQPLDRDLNHDCTYWSKRHAINPIVTPIILLAQACDDGEKDHSDESEEGCHSAHAQLDRPSTIMLTQSSPNLCIDGKKGHLA